MRGNIDLTIGRFSSTASWNIGTVSRDIWILVIWHLVVLLEVVENVWLITSIATVVSVVLTAGDDLLLGEVWKIPSIVEDGALNDGGGTEGVA